MKFEYEMIRCTKSRSSKQIPTRWIFFVMQLVLLIFYFSFNLILSTLIIEEKKEKMKEILQLININPLLNYLSWTFTFTLILSMNSIVIISE